MDKKKKFVLTGENVNILILIVSAVIFVTNRSNEKKLEKDFVEEQEMNIIEVKQY